MRIISIRHNQPGATDFAFAVVEDHKAAAQLAKLEKANHQRVFRLSLFPPDTYGDLLQYVQRENDLSVKEEGAK